MHKPIKYVEKAATVAAKAVWQIFDTLNQISPNPGFTPKWSDKPLAENLRIAQTRVATAGMAVASPPARRPDLFEAESRAHHQENRVFGA